MKMCLCTYMSTELCDMKEEESKADQRKQEVQIPDSDT